MLALAAMAVCMPCHAAIVESYAKTGMGRSFFPMRESSRVEDFTRNNRFFHAASRSWFEMEERGGRFFMRRKGGAFALEKEIHYVLGSGNHARSYVHLTPQGRLLALPVSWYTQEGGTGYWQMAPGFDRPDHPGFRRRIGYDCFFCHNGYPRIPDGAETIEPVYLQPLPEGIDCARCHGSAQAHLKTPGRGNILNPRTLPAARQMEVCLQCHLETTSRPLPHAMRRFGQPFFGYDPAQPLGDYMIHFDHQDAAPWNEKFEVVSAPYRLMQSACYRKSEGRLTCSTCHNPHERPRAESRPCQQCHGKAHAGRVEAAGNCVECHMVKRAPEDAPLTRFTDHKIAKRPETRQGFDLPEYSGPVRVFWPPLDPGGLYLALVNRTGRDRLARRPPADVEALIALAESQGSADLYQRALKAAPTSLAASRGLARLRYPDEGILEKAVKAHPADPFLLTLRGEALRQAGKLDNAERTLRAAIDADPDQVEPYINLGVLCATQGRGAEAIKLFESALAIDPLNQAAILNLRRARGR